MYTVYTVYTVYKYIHVYCVLVYLLCIQLYIHNCNTIIAHYVCYTSTQKAVQYSYLQLNSSVIDNFIHGLTYCYASVVNAKALSIMRCQEDINTEHNIKSIGRAAVAQWTKRLTRNGQTRVRI